MEKTNDGTKSRFWVIALVTLSFLAITTATGDILDSNSTESSLVGLLIIPSLPGFLVYVLVTGDIHGWQPGPIGQVGRIIVTTLGAWIFWTPLIYWIHRRIKRSRGK
jgi:hypothetical protein